MDATAASETKPLLKLSIPLMIGLAAALMIGVVDTIMIAPLGTVPLAAAGIATAVLIIIISALWGIITVLSVRISQADGASDAVSVSSEMRNGIVTALLGGVAGAALMLLTFPLLGPIGQPDEVIAIVFPYWAAMSVWIVPFTLFFAVKALFDAVGREWTGVAISYVGVVFNIPANYLLIYTAELGLVGAGLASVISQSVSLLVAYVAWKHAPSLTKYRAEAKVSLRKVREQLRESLPLCIGYAGEGGAYAFVGIMMGWLGATALAAHQVVNAVGGISYVVPLGLAGAVSIRVGHAVGGSGRGRLRAILKSAIGISILWMSVIAVLYVTLGRPLAELLSDDAAVVALAALLFVIVGLLQVVDGIQGTALGALRGISDNTVPTTITLVAYWALALPVAYILAFPLEMGAVGLWLGYTVGLAVAAVALPWRYWRLTGAPA
ncbi:MAG: MATE family efflux transporter [Pseudomonadota bacterium]